MLSDKEVELVQGRIKNERQASVVRARLKKRLRLAASDLKRLLDSNAFSPSHLESIREMFAEAIATKKNATTNDSRSAPPLPIKNIFEGFEPIP